ncbi:ParB/RepB/Spo0J family partition protein [Nonomuraea sp. KC401]|uniref:ParB/RepB/Spo0J family partition protein n=1 Tax=unclassified Nonomuraea TaxID=2593643 RepID=UPI0010FCEB68|nr:ParB/RepB/Spo0J family partition protein [Nonomuraea sp. KC401]NBE93139.1 ParB/RepB/Spo0J family partition protein [Nonomuraea sp. K271]TLF82877.1 ParB/RepB/Spo0J family partition protein [Nonomuraea sp. KC401]
MSQQRRGLGKGLGALIPTGPIVDGMGAVPSSANGSTAETGPQPVAGAYFKEVALEAIVPNPRQPREVFDGERLEELAKSIREVGLLQPIVVRSVGGGQYELIMGERRWRACKQVGLDPVPAIVRNTQDTDLLRDALIENLQREQLNPLEEAAAYQQLLDDFQATHDQLAQKVGRSRSHITNTLRLLNLPPEIQPKVAAGVISAGHARALLGLSSVEEQIQLAQRIVAELLSVRAVEEIVAMGSAQAAQKAPRERTPSKPTAPGLTHLADRLSDHFETKVKVDLGRRKGRIVVEFATIDDLERIIDTMAPEAVRAMREAQE